MHLKILFITNLYFLVRATAFLRGLLFFGHLNKFTVAVTVTVKVTVTVTVTVTVNVFTVVEALDMRERECVTSPTARASKQLLPA